LLWQWYRGYKFQALARNFQASGLYVIAVTKNPFLKKQGGIDKAYYVDNLGGPEILSVSRGFVC